MNLKVLNLPLYNTVVYHRKSAVGSLTKHSEVSLAFSASSSEAINLAEELPLVREPDVPDDESGSLLV